MPVDVLGFEFLVLETDSVEEFEEEEQEEPLDGIVVYGMFLDGAKWDYDGGYNT